MNKERMNVVEELEHMDAAWREHGIPDRYREKWGVNTNVGLWICGREAAEFLHSEILNRKPMSILELGTSVGYAAIWLGDAAQEVGAHVTTIEKAEFKVKEAKEIMSRCNLPNVEVVEADIEEVLADWQAPIDFVFMDANKRGYLKQFRMIEPHLSEQGVIIADNILDMPEQVAEFIDTLKMDQRYSVDVRDIGHGMAVIERV